MVDYDLSPTQTWIEERRTVRTGQLDKHCLDTGFVVLAIGSTVLSPKQIGLRFLRFSSSQSPTAATSSFKNWRLFGERLDC